MSDGRVYLYRAARKDGVLERGSVEAASREAASALLAARGLFPLEIGVDAQAEARRSYLPLTELAIGLHMLATLLESGLPISRALQALDEIVPTSWLKGLPSIREAVREGKSLATALRTSPLALPPLVLGIIQAGEAGSGLAEAVRRAAEIMDRQEASRAALRSALAYPAILAAAGLGSVALLVGVVLPRFAVILADLGQALPPTTRIVLAAADAMRVAALPGVLALFVLAMLWHAWTGTSAGRERWHELLLRAPLIGRLRCSAATARASGALAGLLQSGVSIAPALLHAAPATGDAAVTARLLAARESILRGQGVARSLEVERAMTPTAIRLVRTGEETGRLAELLVRGARLEGERVERQVQAAVRLLEPVLILLFGGVVALIAASLLQAVYSVRPGL